VHSSPIGASHAVLLDKLCLELGTSGNTSNTANTATSNKNKGRGLGLVLSVLVHVILLAVLAINVRWNTTPPAPYEAVLWASLPGQSTSKPEPTIPKSTPAKPIPIKPTPPKPEPEPKAEPRVKQPDIAINKKPESKKIEPKKPEPPKPKETTRPEPKPPEKTKNIKPKESDKPTAPKETAPSSDTLKKLREEELARSLGGLPSGKANATGSTGRNTAQYSDKIRQHVRSRIVFPGASSVEGNPQVVFEVRQLPTGEIVGVVQKQSSGNSAWDAAVERALQRSSPLPKADDGSVETVLVMSFRLKDQTL
jgi:colicin import membrane protein